MRSEKSDPDFDPTLEDINTETMRISIPKSCDPTNQKVYMVYESCLEKLMKHCLQCGSPVVEIEKKAYFGTQVAYYYNCLNGCETKWYTQPTLDAVKGWRTFILIMPQIYRLCYHCVYNRYMTL